MNSILLFYVKNKKYKNKKGEKEKKNEFASICLEQIWHLEQVSLYRHLIAGRKSESDLHETNIVILISQIYKCKKDTRVWF